MAIDARDARDDLDRLRFRAPGLLDDVLEAGAKRAAEEIASQSPVVTGTFQRSWTTDGPAVVNTADYASDVRNGWVARTLPTIIEDETDQIASELVQAIDQEIL